jgi:hypothetical protein
LVQTVFNVPQECDSLQAGWQSRTVNANECPPGTAWRRWCELAAFSARRAAREHLFHRLWRRINPIPDLGQREHRAAVETTAGEVAVYRNLKPGSGVWSNAAVKGSDNRGLLLAHADEVALVGCRMVVKKSRRQAIVAGGHREVCGRRLHGAGIAELRRACRALWQAFHGIGVVAYSCGVNGCRHTLMP